MTETQLQPPGTRHLVIAAWLIGCVVPISITATIAVVILPAFGDLLFGVDGCWTHCTARQEAGLPARFAGGMWIVIGTFLIGTIFGVWVFIRALRKSTTAVIVVSVAGVVSAMIAAFGVMLAVSAAL